jgi:iron(III) transport system ATP-binding protein
MTKEALKVDAVKKTFSRGEHPALTGISLSIGEGEIVALVGESGSGKTTLLRIIAGLEDPDSGEVQINGSPVCGDGHPVAPDRRHVGLVFQDYALFPHLNVIKNVLYGLHRLPRLERKARAREVIRMSGLGELEHRFPHELSGGQQQRVALARALAPKPALILLDEPFSNLDPMRKDALRREVRRIVKDSKTAALLVTHDTRDALTVADRVAVLKEGTMQQVGTPEEIYFHSTNEYTASLFGKVNRIPCQLFNSWQGEASKPVVWLRPEALEISSEAGDSSREFLVGKVADSVFCGEYRELLIDCGEGEETTRISVFVDPAREVPTGTVVTLRRNRAVMGIGGD